MSLSDCFFESPPQSVENADFMENLQLQTKSHYSAHSTMSDDDYDNDSAIQVAQLSQKYRAAGWVSFGQK